MLGLLPLLGLILLGLSALARGPKDRPIREFVLIGYLLWGLFITAEMEILSVLHGLNFLWVFFCWISVLTACVLVIAGHRKNLALSWPLVRRLTFIEKLFLLVIFLMVSYLVLLAFLSPPNTSDAMTYHLCRIGHWIQNHCLSYYPTNIIRQLYPPPWEEYAIFQFQILSKTDQWANGVQWLCMMGSLVGVSLISKELGAGRWGQILSVLVAATIPMGILQATSTQTDYGVTMWLCLFVYFFIRWRKNFTWEYAWWMAAALGLAFLTKPTGIAYALPFLLWMMGIMVRRIGLKSLGQLAAVVMVVLLLNSGMLYRNAKLFHGHLLASVSAIGGDSLIIEHLGWQELVANTLRNTGLETLTPWMGINRSIERLLHQMGDGLHVDMNDMSSSYQGEIFETSPLSMHEDSAGSLLHVILFMAVLFLVAIFPSLRNTEMVFYLLAVVGMLIAFNLVLKWQYWITRFHLSFFVMAAPLIGAVFERVRPRAITVVIMTVVIACAFPYVLHNPMKSFVTIKNIVHKKDRLEAYFPDPSILSKYKTFRVLLNNIQCHEVGLVLDEYTWEYPFWAVLNPRTDTSIRFEDFEVENISSKLKYPLGSFSPCAIITVSFHIPDQIGVFEKNMFYKLFNYGQAGNETNVFVKVVE